MCSFAQCRQQSEVSRTATIGFAGNAMHTHCCGIVLLYALTQVEEHTQVSDPDLSSLAAALEADFW